MAKYSAMFSSSNRTSSASMLNTGSVKTGQNTLNRFELERFYRIGNQIGSYGLELYWKIYQAHRIESNEECSLFIFDKRQIMKQYKAKHRDIIIDVARQDLTHIQSFHNPRILKITYTIEETNDEIAFAAEPLRGSLSNLLLINSTNKTKFGIENEVCDLSDLEKKLGIYQLTECLRYLHTSQLYIHGNITPNSVLITKHGDWKLAGLNFMERIFPGQMENATKGSSWNPKLPSLCQPDLDYLAPECIGISTSSSASDMFSLGQLIITIFNDGQSLLKSNFNLNDYHYQIEKLHELFNKVVDKIPRDLIEAVEKMINKDIRYRPSSQLFSLLKYFNDKRILALDNLSTIDNKSYEEKRDLFLSLSGIVDQFEETFLVSRLYPTIFEKLLTCNVVYPEIVDTISSIIKHVNHTSYQERIRPSLLNHLRSVNSAQQYIAWIHHADALLSKLSEKEIQQEIVPLWISCLDLGYLDAQICALESIQIFLPYLNETFISNNLILKLKTMLMNKKFAKVQVVAIEGLAQILPSLSRIAINEQILPVIKEVGVDSPDMLKGKLGLYQEMLGLPSILTAQNLATEIIQSLLPQTLNSQLNYETFSLLFDVLHLMLDRISQERGRTLGDFTSKNYSAFHSLSSTRTSGIRVMTEDIAPILSIKVNEERNETQKNFSNVPNSLGVIPPAFNSPRTAPTTPEIILAKRCHKTNSNPSIIIATGIGNNQKAFFNQQKSTALLTTHSLSIDEPQQSLLVPQISSRRHSYGSVSDQQSQGNMMITEGISDGPFISPPSSRPTSRRPSAVSQQIPIINNNYLQQSPNSKINFNNSAQNLSDNLTVIPVVRRSSFNSLSDTVMNFFGT